MPRFDKRYVAISIILLIFGVFAGTAALSQERTRSIMHSVFEAIAYLLPLSLRESDDMTDLDQELIAEKLQVLTESAGRLVDHGKTKDQEFGSLARSFEQTVEDIDAAFKAEWPTYAYLAMLDLTQHCVACHARLPSETTLGFGESLLARIDIDALDRRDKAYLYVATRQFDQALTTFEEVLMDEMIDPIDSDLAGTFIEYLNLNISILQDLERPADFITNKYGQRADIPFYIERRLAIWEQAIESLANDLAAKPSLANARRIFNIASAMTVAPAGRERAVHDLVAYSILQRYVADNRVASDADIAEAYYLLAVIALRTTELKPSVPQMELLLEAAIRRAPKGPFAAASYAMLEEYGFIDEYRLAEHEDAGPLINVEELRGLMGK